MKITGLRCEHLLNAKAVDTKKPVFSWIIESDERNVKQQSYKIIVSADAAKIKDKKGEMWNPRETVSSETLNIEYAGRSLKPFTKYYWAVIVKNSRGEKKMSEISSFVTGRLDSHWPAKWIFRKEKQGRKKNAGYISPYFFKKFSLNKTISEAYLFCTAKGVYKLLVNGQRVSECEFGPGWTDYHKTFYYQGYDITQCIKTGENAIGVSLGDGWYFGNLSAVGRYQYGKYPRMFTAFVKVNYTDGTSETVITDSSWTAGTGPVIYADLQTGEYYDSNLELPDFATTEFDDRSFKKANSRSVKEKLSGQKGEEIAKIEEIVPVSCNKVKGKYIFDMGQNMVGRVRLKARGHKDKKLRLRYGEMLNTDKSLYTANLRSCEATDYYVFHSDEPETWEASFTIHGFRYVEISGLDYFPTLDTLTGIVLHNNLSISGSIDTNDGFVNKLFKNIMWGQKGNFLAVPTDCPQRDERLGWTGDSQIFCRSGCFNMHSEGFYEKYVQDVYDEQKETGEFTDIAPYIHWPNGQPLVGFGNAAWGDAGVIMPYLLYKIYKNKRILRQCFSGMVRYIEALDRGSEGHLRTAISYGDWLCVGEMVPYEVLNTAYFAYVTGLTVEIAGILGETEEEKRLARKHREIIDAFRKAYVDKDGIIKGDKQTGYVLALKFRLCDDDKELRSKIVRHLYRTLEESDWHLTTGFVGVKDLLPVLCDEGFEDISYKLLHNKTYPSWMYSIINGATTVWERWNSYTLEGGFADIAMNSFNHYSLGSVAEWMYEYMGGIKRVDAGYYSFELKPYISGLERADVRYDSPNGRIVSSWKKSLYGYTIDIEVPANTSCVLRLPAEKGSVISEETGADEFDFTYENGRLCSAVPSGSYRFRVTNR